MTTRYNHGIPFMQARSSRRGWLTLLLAMFATSSFLAASNPSSSNPDATKLVAAARQLASRIAPDSGPGGFSVEIANRSSLNERSVEEIRDALETELHGEGVQIVKPEQAIGSIAIVLSESLREYVWTAEIAIGSDEKKVVLVSLPRTPKLFASGSDATITLKAAILFTREQPILDAAEIEIPGGSRLIVLGTSEVTIFHRQNHTLVSSAQWELETSLPVDHGRVFPRDVRGHLLLRRDHLFDAQLPGTICHSSSNAASPLTLACADSDDPWPLTSEDGTVHAFFAASRNFFTGALAPGIGKISTVPAFYSAAVLPRPGYRLWSFVAIDGSMHLVDGITDQLIRGRKWGSDIVAIHSACGLGTQLISSDNGNPAIGNSATGNSTSANFRDELRAFEIPDRDPVAVSSALEFDGRITALWQESGGNGAVAVVKRNETGWYETYRISVSCGTWP